MIMEFPSNVALLALFWEVAIFFLLLVVFPEPWIYISYGALNLVLTVFYELRKRKKS
mgnify:CR=1 FL=1